MMLLDANARVGAVSHEVTCRNVVEAHVQRSTTVGDSGTLAPRVGRESAPWNPLTRLIPTKTAAALLVLAPPVVLEATCIGQRDLPSKKQFDAEEAVRDRSRLFVGSDEAVARTDLFLDRRETSLDRTHPCLESVAVASRASRIARGQQGKKRRHPHPAILAESLS